jgi:drug/metabolite transporter (DMT)-like permease
MVIAIVFSIAFFGDWPSALAWGGIALIGGSGVYIFLREAWLGRKSRAGPQKT